MVHEGTGSVHKDGCGTFKKFVRNSEYGKYGDIEKIPVLAQILSFLQKMGVMSKHGKGLKNHCFEMFIKWQG